MDDKKSYKLRKGINNISLNLLLKVNREFGIEFVIEDGKIVDCYANGGKR